MKRIIAKRSFFFLLLLLFFGLGGCNTAPPINHPPTISSSAITNATMNVAYSYDVHATDSDGDTLTYSLTTSPTGMTINPSTGLINWTPTPAQEGDTSVTVEVTDGEFEDSQSFVITFQATVEKPVHNMTQSTHYMTIQAALNAAQSGDTIEVANGVYNESITFPSGKLIILRSVNGDPDTTFIIGAHNASTVTCNHSFEGTKLQGFTISHKSGTSGAGVYNHNGTLMIVGCTISGNSAADGGGIVNDHSTLSISGCNISGNSADTSGGGILNDNATLTIIGNSIISHNTANNGGGICNYHGTLTVTGGSIISENSADSDGGGIMNDDGTTTVSGGSTVSENSALASGGGIFNSYGLLTVTGSTISENSTDTDDAWRNGGGICNSHGTLTVTQGSIISENSTYCWGGGIFNSDGILTVTGSIISENSAVTSGGGIYMYPGPLPSNTIIGGSSGVDTANFNSFINNKKGDTISSAQHIRSTNSADIHDGYPYNYYTPN